MSSRLFTSRGPLGSRLRSVMHSPSSTVLCPYSKLVMMAPLPPQVLPLVLHPEAIIGPLVSLLHGRRPTRMASATTQCQKENTSTSNSAQARPVNSVWLSPSKRQWMSLSRLALTS
eukprot:Rmarinus@m.5622